MFGREPVVIITLVRSLILCAVAFGLRWDPPQIAATMVAVEAALAALTRSQVSPVQ